MACIGVNGVPVMKGNLLPVTKLSNKVFDVYLDITSCISVKNKFIEPTSYIYKSKGHDMH